MTTHAKISDLQCRVPEYCVEYEQILDYADSIKDNLEAFIAFTWTPDPRRYISSDPARQWLALLNNVLLTENMKRTFIKYLFVPEVTQQGNIHVHGVFAVNDKIKYHKWFIPACKRWGYIYPKTRVDDNWTRRYMAKECDWMVGIVDPWPTIITEQTEDRIIQQICAVNGMIRYISKNTPAKIVVYNKKTSIMKYI